MIDGTASPWIDHYLSRGWALVPLHDVSSGTCSCGRRDPEHDRRQGGKHPVAELWQRDVVRTRAQWDAITRERPRANVGVATGEPSGFWALDVDPDNGGDERLSELEREYGPLPLTRTHRSGSGGIHLLWALPDWRLGNGRGRLPVGLDVRGTGGQIVVEPSVSGKGSYTVVRDVPIVRAPAWLEDLIRPVQYDPPTPSGQPGERGDERGRAYARSAVDALAGELAGAGEGERNGVAYRVACRLLELANAAWSGVTQEDAVRAYMAAARAADENVREAGGSAFPFGEAREVWGKAARHVAGRAATLPVSPYGGEFIPFELAPGGAATSTLGTGVEDGTNSGGRDWLHNSEPVVIVTEPVDPVSAMMAELLTAAQLRSMPRPAPLVAGLLDLNTCAWLIGKPGSYKSFVALSLAASVGSGKDWLGRPVRQGLVVYLVAEGLSGTTLRVAAYERQYGPMDGVVFFPRPVLADERRGVGEWSVLVEMLRRLAPTMVVIDTQSRVGIGLKENDNTEMMILVSQISRIQHATGACVLTVHHIGRTGADARGASSIDGAQDSELRVERTGDLRVTLHQDKQKDGDDSETVRINLVKVSMGADPDTGRDLSSLVVAPSGYTPPVALPDWLTGTTETQGWIVSVVMDHYDQVGGTKAEMRATAIERFGRIPRTTFDRAWDGLVGREVLIRVDGTQRYILASSAAARPGA
jgi:hypothetical protein